MEVDLWLWRLDADPETRDAYTRLLDESERARAARFVAPTISHRFIVAHGRMREILSQYVNAPAETLRFAEVSRKKPVLPGGPAFNLSHSGGYAALAVCAEPDLPLGVDIEEVRPLSEDLCARIFVADELADLAGMSGEDHARAAIRGWTCKEALCKATGEGLYADLMQMNVALAGDVAVRWMGPSFPPAEDWALTPFPVPDGLMGTVAAVTQGREMRVRMQDAP